MIYFLLICNSILGSGCSAQNLTEMLPTEGIMPTSEANSHSVGIILCHIMVSNLNLHLITAFHDIGNMEECFQLNSSRNGKPHKLLYLAYDTYTIMSKPIHLVLWNWKLEIFKSGLPISRYGWNRNNWCRRSLFS